MLKNTKDRLVITFGLFIRKNERISTQQLDYVDDMT